ncbi:hypothetical protein BMT55_16605 [Listeria newyorkensis]|uniref:HTH cro/C1-type domain-containing protein n=1 Tax=Listeria newyorkensis TaxID=1497681 RepID=A0ABX4XHL8_9LIST|nr:MULTISPECIES: helix-turn-helix transcriptional regulator [Listeria]KGL39579.1 hypothetical protein EP56_13530 [Listeriaceae bacterium FSL A5-0209]KGL44149.1 hypothetical protein EP58_06795 [Listeria newyorkensis]PNP87053.1 hypothetical protein BMT55_16605 [Listeria newyorkensis]RQW67125.1 XRE family transcriptional regulator [Listeria sp. SHR_NRA_18]WAO21745.1 helix-turn-helix transcriptional regulator [Listeria newyorkensis]
MNQLGKLRESMGLSQKSLADVLNIKQQTVSSWERGRTSPSPYYMQKIEGIFGVKKEIIFQDAFYKGEEGGIEL